MQKKYLLNLLSLLFLFKFFSAQVGAEEEYMRRGASVDDYEQALGRVLHRGVTPARKLLEQSAPEAQPAVKSTAPVNHTRPTKAATQPKSSEHGLSSSHSANNNGVSIYFGYNSAQLTPEAQDELKKLGQALASPKFRDTSWFIEGHTDGAGSSDYNRHLSKQRAESARDFLIQECGIAANRLTAVGRGKSEPYDAQHPTASVNRRVRLRPAD